MKKIQKTRSNITTIKLNSKLSYASIFMTPVIIYVASLLKGVQAKEAINEGVQTSLEPKILNDTNNESTQVKTEGAPLDEATLISHEIINIVEDQDLILMKQGVNWVEPMSVYQFESINFALNSQLHDDNNPAVTWDHLDDIDSSTSLLVDDIALLQVATETNTSSAENPEGSSYTWLWVLLGSPAVAGIVTGIVLGTENNDKTKSDVSTQAPITADDDPVAEDMAMPIYLTQADFENGTYQINESGTYILTENISFNPNSKGTEATKCDVFLALPGSETCDDIIQLDAYSAGKPLVSQFTYAGGEYDPAAFGIGFFAAIAISADDVTVDLNGYTLEQHEEHALLQRFFAVIETADRPFITGQGPHTFGDLVPANDVTIMNGTIGRSSHHGIHGNGSENVTIENVDFVDYEVAAVALNGVQGLTIENVTAQSSDESPVLATFSNARFIGAFVDYAVLLEEAGMPATTLNLPSGSLSAQDIQDALRDIINATHDALIVQAGDDQTYGSLTPGTDAHNLFHNELGIIDALAYGFLVNPLGVAVGGFPVQPTGEDDMPSTDITFKNVIILDHVANGTENVAIHSGLEDNKHQKDPVGAILQILNNTAEGEPVTLSSFDLNEATYEGTALTNAQLWVAKAISNDVFEGSPLDTSRNSITQEVWEWAESGDTLQTLIDSVVTDNENIDDPQEFWRCNGDIMFHVNKGVVGFKIDGANHVLLENTAVINLGNIGDLGSDFCGEYTFSHPDATLEGYGGAFVRAYSFAGSTNVTVDNAVVEKVYSHSGPVVAFDIMTDTQDINLIDYHVEALFPGTMLIDPSTPPNPPNTAADTQVSEDATGVYFLAAADSSYLADYDSDGILNEDEQSGACKYFANDGDADLNGIVDESDIEFIYDLILADDGSKPTKAELCHADITNDGMINELDIIKIMEITLEPTGSADDLGF